MFKSVLIILSLLFAPIGQSFGVYSNQNDDKTPYRKVLFQKMKAEFGDSYTASEYKTAIDYLIEESGDKYYHEEDIVSHLKDKLELIHSKGVIYSGNLTPVSEGGQEKLNTNGLHSETYRYTTAKILGYEKDSLGIEIKRVLDDSGESVDVMIGIRVYATANFLNVIDSTSVVLNSDMTPVNMRLKVDQAMSILARQVGVKVSDRMDPELTSAIMTTFQMIGGVAFASSFYWVVKRLVRGKGSTGKKVNRTVIISWVASIALYFLLSEKGDYRVLDEVEFE